jgi:hypothetical protein
MALYAVSEPEGPAVKRVDSARLIPSYERHLAATADWLVRSIEQGKGGSCAYFSPLTGWSRPYPETTGYLIPTLIALSQFLNDFDGEGRALELGSWLLTLQAPDGWWHGGLHPPKGGVRPSVFNTAQILQGLIALHDLTDDERWLESAARGARWLAGGVALDGLWAEKDYRSLGTPSYYTYAAWPMLEVAVRRGDETIRNAAEGVLGAILTRQRPNGAFSRWAFSEGEPAFTHTIAYTLQGLIESAKLLGDWDTYGAPTQAALTALVRIGELENGRLPGRLDDDWVPAAGYVCLTGNAQTALCLLDWEARQRDPSLVRAAAALIDAVCAAQRLRVPLGALRGAVGGSAPIWGRYMVFRYPNWAAKYHCDALMRLIGRLREEREP